MNSRKALALAFILLLLAGMLLTGCSTPAPATTPGETPITAAQQPAEPAQTPEAPAQQTPAETGSTTDTQAEEPSYQILKDLNPQQAFDLIQENKDNADFIIIDVRTPGEYATGHIENAINIDYYSATFREDLNKLDKNKKYLIYCRSGARSGNSLSIMGELGFNEVYNILGGINAWVDGGFEAVKATEELQASAKTEAEEAPEHVEGALQWTEEKIPAPMN